MTPEEFLERTRHIPRDRLVELLWEYQQLLLQPPPGWYAFGHHAHPDRSDIEVRFWGTDPDSGMPVWERPTGVVFIRDYPADKLYGADPDCAHEVVHASGGGVKCRKCPGWYCA